MIDLVNFNLPTWYERLQYGTIPAPVRVSPVGVPPLTPAGTVAPDFNLDTWLTQEAKAVMDRTKEAQQQAYSVAIAEGTWSPEGKLPFTATQLDEFMGKYGVLIFLAAGALGVAPSGTWF